MTLKMLEKAVKNLKPADQRKFLCDLPNLLHMNKEDFARLKTAEKSFKFWDNKEDSIYDTL